MRPTGQNRLKDGRTEVPAPLPGETKLFNVPRDLIGIFDRDLAAADIPKTDADGRTVDVHSLRHDHFTAAARARMLKT